ncbi:ATP-dependent DNA helicase Q 1 [Spatholobus suberectus]|nr:ATP-dependent DNA helicase Q 1 [Spatholobus suberectus]
MEDFQRSRSYANGQMMQIERYYGAPRPYDLRSYSASYAQTQIGPRDLKLKKGKSISAGSSFSKSWSFADPELQRKKRVASYKMYSVEGKIKGSFRKSFRWLKNKYSQVVYGW